MEKKNILGKIFFPVIILILLISLVLAYFLVWRIPTAQQVFNDSIYSVVELKGQTGEDIVSYGSAVFIDKDGSLATNAHMTAYKKGGEYKSFETLSIRFSFEEEYRAVLLVKADLEQDMAILKLVDTENANFKPLSIRKAPSIKTGEKVYAVGNGMNHGLGLTKGIVSLPSVNIDYDEKIRNVIQCDLIINDGNSGGALLDEKGKLIGITTFRIKDNAGNVVYGMAFCIPISKVMDYLKSL